MSFSKYISQFAKNVDSEQTHLSFNNGKFNVPDSHFEEFYQKYHKTIHNKNNSENLFLIEKVYNSNFAFFLDLDMPKEKEENTLNKVLCDESVIDIIEITKNTINNMFKTSKDECDITKYIVSKRITDNGENYHINFYNLIVNNIIAKKLATDILDNKNTLSENLKRCIDLSVYRTGLRLLGSKKFNKNKNTETNSESIQNIDTYRIYNLEQKTFTELYDTSFEKFIQTIVRRKKSCSLTDLKNPITTTEIKKPQVKGINNPSTQKELVKLLTFIKSTNESIKNFDTSIQRISTTTNKSGFFSFYVTINGKYCPFKDRDHKRDNSPIYFEINSSGIYLKCYDEDCLRRRFPENGIKLPNNFETEYPQLFLSMTTKYWNTEIKITDEIKTCLEASLNGSHYQIAKTVFQIYKDRFRIDDIKNTEWYEFNGVRWKKSLLMNILISEDLPKYYRSIKIRDTSIQNKDLEEFLVNNDKVDSNMRNQMVDNIISKLENFNFKNNIMSQISYMFKTHDPDFYTHLDSTPNLIGFKNGVYDFNTNSFRNGKQDDYITFSTGYDYIDYDEKCKQTQEIYTFLKKIITNKKMLEYTLKVLGKSLVGLPDERFYIWTGLSGANGKSTLVNFLENTLGEYIASVDVSLLTNKRGSSSNASPDVVRLRGKRLFTFQEPEHTDKLRTGILKQYTGGDTIIARELFKAPISFKLQGTMIMCCNDLPSVNSIDSGTWRRIRVIEFKSRFCDNPVKPNEFKIDPSIKYKIKEWRPYFMSILLHWYNRFLEEGMNEPEEVKKATAKYKVDNDKFNEFFDQCLQEQVGTFESNKTIYSNFSNWWSNNYPNSKIPEMKELRRSLKIKYGKEEEKVVHGCTNYGFNVTIKNLHTEIDSDDDL
jgi:P4 family phage/plasmid primase-like protien